jgi:hypothetical protein
VDNCSSMPSTSSVKNFCEKNVIFVPASRDKGKKVLVNPYMSRSKSTIVHPHKKHHCSKVGHTRPHFYNLKPREHKSGSSYSRNSHEELFNMMRVVLTTLDELSKSHKSAPSVKKV